MPRYIDADKLIEEYKGNILTAQTDYAEGCRDIIEDIKNAPTADVQEVKHAHWVIIEYEYLNCSHCGEAYYTGADSTKQAREWLEKGYAYSYCPNCGAKMDKEDGK